MGASATLLRRPCTEVRVEDLRPGSDGLPAGERWQQLATLAETELFSSHFWVEACSRAFGADKPARVLAVLSESENPIAFLPLWAHRRFATTWLESLAAVERQRCPLVCRADDLRTAALAIARHLKSGRDWDVLDLQRLAPAEADEFKHALSLAGLRWKERGRTFQRYVPLDRPWHDVLCDMRRSLRQRLPRQLRRMERELGKLEIEVIESPGAFADAFNDCLRLEASGWKGREGTAISCRPELIDFYLKLGVALAERREVRIFFLRAGERRIAFFYCAFARGMLHGLKSGYDEALRLYSPAAVLQFMILRDASDLGVRRYDMAGADEPWKAEWTPHGRWVYNLRCWNKSIAGRALELRSRCYGALLRLQQ